MFYVMGTRKGYDGKDGIYNLVGGRYTAEEVITAALDYLTGPLARGINYTSLALINGETDYVGQLDFVSEIKSRLKIVKR
ncbi:hypothetical protein LCGC14_1539210 [marine sediment metagenome]|uniref:Uncharacterized protein n=1 Tax=marine sediment metagenome TaxID=412755 RepID=A0A0F9LUC0_9ZZZZ